MASPETPMADYASHKSGFDQITFRFCSECSNMLYPKEDEESHTLQFTCRTCQYAEEAKSSCIFRNTITSAQAESAGDTQDVGSDPTFKLSIFNGQASPNKQRRHHHHHHHQQQQKQQVHDEYLLEPEWNDDPSAEYDEEPESEASEMASSPVSDDWQLPRTAKQCPVCRHEEAVFFQSQQRSEETGMKLFYVCCQCGYTFT